MVVMIHSCNNRLWYVQNFIVPNLRQQGIKDIIVWNDDKSIGCLKSFVKSMIYVSDNMPKNRGIWHLQDDVLCSASFAERAGLMPKNIVCNGFVSKLFCPNDFQYVGLQPVGNNWLSFQCIYIPNVLCSEFSEWFIDKVIIEQKYSKYSAANKYDDFFFWQFMRERHKESQILNIAPNLVDHVDYLLGGSIVNDQRRAKQSRAFFWAESELNKELEVEIKKWQDRRKK